MRFHTLALTAVLGYVAKKPLVLARYRFRVVMEFTKISQSRSSGLQRGSYYISLDLQSPKSSQWRIEQVENDRPENKDRNYPELKKFEFSSDGSATIQIDHSRAKEYSIDISSDNRRDVDISYKSIFGYGTARGTFTSECDQMRLIDVGPTPQNEIATIDATIRFDQIMKL
jgi:hypothetical protein